MIVLRVVFVEPPKEYWFVMGEYLPPPTGAIQLAAYLESKRPKDEISVIDCQAEGLGWDGLEKRLSAEAADVVAVSSMATCNAYTTIRALETAKMVTPDALTMTGGQHFTALAEASLQKYPVVDVIVMGEGERTLVDVVETKEAGRSFANVEGLCYRDGSKVVMTPPRPLIEDLDELPMPGYHFVEGHVDKYHFKMMAGSKRYVIIEGSRGCSHGCTFCSQCAFWGWRWRSKSAKRIANEMQYCHERFGAEFIWLTDDNFAFGPRSEQLTDELIGRGLGNEILWFVQARVDDVVNNEHMLPKLRRSGNTWQLLGVETGDPRGLERFGKDIDPDQSKRALSRLKDNDIFAQATFIIGNRYDSRESIAGLRRFADELDPDLAIFMILTPFPGTKLYEEAVQKGWIEDWNWTNYDMVHAVMSTDSLNRQEVQRELYDCYRRFYGRIPRLMQGVFSLNSFKRRTYRYLASQNLLGQLRDMF